jgi:hypothetical protein
MALRCLIVDDNAGFRDEVRALLEETAGISGSREEYDRRVMPSQWAGAATEPLARARQLQRTSERLRAQDEFGIELSPEATARA